MSNFSTAVICAALLSSMSSPAGAAPELSKGRLIPSISFAATGELPDPSRITIQYINPPKEEENRPRSSSEAPLSPIPNENSSICSKGTTKNIQVKDVAALTSALAKIGTTEGSCKWRLTLPRGHFLSPASVSIDQANVSIIGAYTDTTAINARLKGGSPGAW